MCLSKGTAAFEFVSGLMYVKHHSLFIAIHEMMRLNDFWKTPSKMWNLPLRGRSDCRPTAPGCGCPFRSHFPVGHTEEKFGSFLSSCLSPTWKSADFVLRTSTYGLFWRRSVAVLKSFFFSTQHFGMRLMRTRPSFKRKTWTAITCAYSWCDM